MRLALHTLQGLAFRPWATSSLLVKSLTLQVAVLIMYEKVGDGSGPDGEVGLRRLRRLAAVADLVSRAADGIQEQAERGS